jgi:hypothetical protein
VVGDGNIQPVVLTGDKLYNHDALSKAGASISLQKTIKDTSESLSKKLYQLEESGSTALGPALLVSTAIAAQKPGSKVILCTDGT